MALKASRQKGFLTPTLELNIGGDMGALVAPYYLPLSQSADIVLNLIFILMIILKFLIIFS